MTKWYQHSYRRNLIDMHITDWDERFLAEFDPDKYVETVCSAQADAAMVYAHSHVGNCYYPTKVGHQHASLHGRDIFGQVVDGFHQRGLDVIAYFSLIYDDYSYRRNPDWRMTLVNGAGAAEKSRYGICCPNSSYREYAAAHVRELCSLYKFEGIFLDMTFWPAICYCPHCQRRFLAETGQPLPTIINWEDPHWVSFQRRREAWLVEFAHYITTTIREVAPEVSIQHQASTYPLNWRFGVTDRLATENDYLGGDFYGDALQGSVVRKLFHNLSPNLPQEFMTSFSTNLQNHTAKKSKELLQAKASACLADGAAFLFIDAIDPAGTINPSTYQRMSAVFDQTKLYEPFIGGEQVQDVAIYLNTEAKHNPADNGKVVDDPTLASTIPHVEAALCVAQTLIENHIPFGVITRNSLPQLSRFKLVILPNMLALSEAEAEAFRSYVGAGGKLYASKYASLIGNDGVRHVDFMLSDVFGISYVGETREAFTYIAPESATGDLLAGYSAKWPLGLDQSQVMLQAHPGTQILGRLTLPYTLPSDPRRFASIHSNPPGIATGYPALVLHTYGKGQACYSAMALEGAEMHRDIIANIVRMLAAPFSVRAEAPKAVEVTTYHQPDNQRYIVSLVNFQKELPNIPVNDIKVAVSLGGHTIKQLLLLPAAQSWPYTVENGYAIFTAPTLETLAMFALDYA
ncbi:MAG: alpha-L-fucosidase [Chloroflexi bacterium]|nr:alpha-L-fucosidase [Chloroflexota bacterium]